jgi:tetratricopeptide (TPR) repeat protein
LAGEVREQLSRAVGSARTERVEKRLAEAAEHFEAERYGDAARILKKSVDEAPTVAAVHELYGLTLYRQEKWKPAARELEAFRLLSNSTDQHPVLADCYRAMRQWTQVGELWDELRAASPSAELVTEGRIVMAGSLADRNDLAGAISLLEQSFNFPKRPISTSVQEIFQRPAQCLVESRTSIPISPMSAFGFGRFADLSHPGSTLCTTSPSDRRSAFVRSQFWEASWPQLHNEAQHHHPGVGR